MRGVYLSYVSAPAEGGKRKLEARIEEHVSIYVREPTHIPLIPNNRIFARIASRDHDHYK